jgi:hypothetical protein
LSPRERSRKCLTATRRLPLGSRAEARGPLHAAPALTEVSRRHGPSKPREAADYKALLR